MLCFVREPEFLRNQPSYLRAAYRAQVANSERNQLIKIFTETSKAIVQASNSEVSALATTRVSAVRASALQRAGDEFSGYSAPEESCPCPLMELSLA